MIEQLDYLIRLVAIGAGLMLIAQVVAGEIRDHIKFPIVAMLVGVIAYLINASPLMLAESPIDPWVDLFAISAPFWIWLFGRRLFERAPEQRIMLSAAALMTLGWFLANFVPFTGLSGFLLLHIVALLLVADLVRIGIFERDDDLVEQRRLVRLWLPLLVALKAGKILLVEVLELFTVLDSSAPAASLFNSATILVLMLFSALALFGTNRDLLPLEQAEDSIDPQEDLIPDLDLSPPEKVLHEKLLGAMDSGEYKSPGLTISALAKQLDTPAHRLRALINGRLGHRNFSAFLNRYRIAEAQRMLSSGEHVDLPILTIAMDLGYNSLAPFNRAFRELTGSSPSEFRKRAFVEDPQEPVLAGTDQK